MHDVVSKLSELRELNETFLLALEEARLKCSESELKSGENEEDSLLQRLHCFDEPFRIAIQARELKLKLMSDCHECNEYSLAVEDKDLSAFARLLMIKGDLPFERFLLRAMSDDDSFNIDDTDDIVSNLFYSWFCGADYVNRLLEVGLLIVPVEIPQTLRNFLESAVKSYIFHIDNAVISLCRTVIEAALKDICVQKSLVEFKTDQHKDKGSKFNNMLKLCTKGNEDLHKGLKNIYEDELSIVVHGNSIAEGDSLKILHQTFDLIRELYISNFR